MLDYHSLWHSLLPLYDPSEAQAVVRYVLEEQYSLTLTDIVSGGLERMTDSEKEKLQGIMQRLQKGEPVQYVLGYAYFCGRKYHVEPGVLIPRPETEQLCERIIQNSKFKIQNSKFNAQRSTLNALDVGTGSGCIAITLALGMPGTKVAAVDISEKALWVARQNAKSLCADVFFIKGDALELDNTLNGCRQFDVIVSNPPYVTMRERQDMQCNVTDYEPSSALFVPDDDPLLFYRAIAAYAASHLSADGNLCFEINPLFAGELRAMLLAQGFRNVSILNDDFGKERFAISSF